MKINRIANNQPLILRAAEGDKPPMLVGYAAVFNECSSDVGGFRERILPGAFAASLAGGADIRALCDHDKTRILGRTSNGTLRLREDEKGLSVEIDVPDTTYGRDLMEMVKRGDIEGMSFGFAPPDEKDVNVLLAGNQVIAELRSVNLREVSTTGTPAYSSTELELRSYDEMVRRVALGRLSEIERLRGIYRRQITMG